MGQEAISFLLFWEFFGIPSWLGVRTIFQTANWLLSGEKKCIAYSLFCIFIIIIVIIITIISISIYYVVSLNCLYLIPQISPFVHFSSPSFWGGKGGVSKWLSGAELSAAGLNYDIDKACFCEQ